MSWPKPVTLHSKTVQLEPLSIDHVSDLINAVKDGNLYNHWYTSCLLYTSDAADE